MSDYRFLNGHVKIGTRHYMAATKPTSTKFTLLKGIHPIAHFDLTREFLVNELIAFYKKLEYDPAYYALMRHGGKPEELITHGVKLYLLSDLLHKALWSKKHLVWFSRDMKQYRVRRSTVFKDTMCVIQGLV